MGGSRQAHRIPKEQDQEQGQVPGTGEDGRWLAIETGDGQVNGAPEGIDLRKPLADALSRPRPGTWFPVPGTYLESTLDLSGVGMFSGHGRVTWPVASHSMARLLIAVKATHWTDLPFSWPMTFVTTWPLP